MNVTVELQQAVISQQDLPSEESLAKWAQKALEIGGRTADAELTVRLVEPEEIKNLNAIYRHIDKPTNILSFPFECPAEVKLPLIGDLIVCMSVLRREAQEQHKSVEEHFAHLIVHGTLHLIGYDHIEPQDAAVMEPLEIKAVEALGYDNPYKDDEI